MANYVAVTGIDHGVVEDGENRVYRFKAGDGVDNLPEDVLRDLYLGGSVTKAGSPDDPNTWDAAPDTHQTTPRFVEDVLLQQAKDKEGPGEFDPVTTGGPGEVPDDPKALLTGESSDKVRPGPTPAPKPTPKKADS